MLHRMSSGKMTCVGKRRYWVWGSFREGESGELMMTNVRKGDSDRCGDPHRRRDGPRQRCLDVVEGVISDGAGRMMARTGSGGRNVGHVGGG